MYEYPTRLSDIYNAIIDHGIATEAEVDLCTGIHGFTEEELSNIVYYRTGLYSISKLLDEEVEE